MNKYRDKSYFEINKAVAEELKLIYEIDYSMRIVVIGEHIIYNPCLNPDQAMPIVIKNRISIESRFNGHYDEWYASLQTNKILIDATGTNYYRTAMEVFLMMKDAENEKV